MDDIRDSGVEFGVLPIPKWDEKQENYIASTSDRQLCILNTIEDKDRTATLTEAMSSAGYRIMRPAYFDVALTKKFTPDPESTDILYLISDALCADLAFLNGSGDKALGRVLIYSLKNNDDNIASRIAEQLPVEQKGVDTLNEFYFGK